MRFSKPNSVLFLFSLLPISLLSQDEHDHSGHNHGHSNHRNELEVATSPVYFVKEEEFSFGLHLHYVRQIKDTKFGIGAGYERIFDEHLHNTFGIVANFRSTS